MISQLRGDVLVDVLAARMPQKQPVLGKLSEAARGVFHSEGYSAATTDDIVAAADASRAALWPILSNL